MGIPHGWHSADDKLVDQLLILLLAFHPYYRQGFTLRQLMHLSRRYRVRADAGDHYLALKALRSAHLVRVCPFRSIEEGHALLALARAELAKQPRDIDISRSGQRYVVTEVGRAAGTCLRGHLTIEDFIHLHATHHSRYIMGSLFSTMRKTVFRPPYSRSIGVGMARITS